MILVDTSIWIDHLRAGDEGLKRLLEAGLVLGHTCVTGELAMGPLADRQEVLGLLENLPQAITAQDAEIMALIETRQLFGRGIGYVDAHLLAATLLTPDAKLWTRDKRLASAATYLQVGVSSSPQK